MEAIYLGEAGSNSLARNCILRCCNLGPQACQYIWIIWGRCYAVSCNPDTAADCQPKQLPFVSQFDSIYFQMAWYKHSLEPTGPYNGGGGGNKGEGDEGLGNESEGVTGGTGREGKGVRGNDDEGVRGGMGLEGEEVGGGDEGPGGGDEDEGGGGGDEGVGGGDEGARGGDEGVGGGEGDEGVGGREGEGVGGREGEGLGGVGGTSEEDEDVGTDADPIANAGPDVTITYPNQNSVILNGSQSRADQVYTSYSVTRIVNLPPSLPPPLPPSLPQGIAYYLWQLVSEDPPDHATLINPTLPDLQVVNLLPGEYSFTLTVADAALHFATDTVTVHVLRGEGGLGLNLVG